MGGRHSSIYTKTSDTSSDQGHSQQKDEENSSMAQSEPRGMPRDHSKNLAMAVAEANERLFIENARRTRQSLSVRSLFSTATGTGMALSDRQKDIIKQTWKLAIADGKLRPGISIFQNIFRRCPDLKDVFRLGHVHNLDDLPKEERFLRHANVFSDVIDLAVRNMDELDVQMAPALITLGRRHYYKHNVGFRPDYLAVFAQAMLDFVTERLQLTGDKEAIDGWWLITVYLVTKLQHGYALESMGKSTGRFKFFQSKKTS